MGIKGEKLIALATRWVVMTCRRLPLSQFESPADHGAPAPWHHWSVRHNLPPTPAFRDANKTDQIQEIALRVIVELPDWEFHVMGTATLIAGNLAVTARHVLDEVVRTFGARQSGDHFEIGCAIGLWQMLPGPVYRKWSVLNVWTCASDIAILHLALDRTSEPDETVVWRVPQLRALPPASGEKVIAFGYRESRIAVSEGSDGTRHINLDDVPTISIGEVGNIFPTRRDSSMLTFPCFEVRARFAPGMSGGLVIDERGAVCGLVCAGTTTADPDAVPLSYAATLWPMLTAMISADRGEAYPRGIAYPVIDLAFDGLLNVVGLEDLDPGLFPGRQLPSR